MREHNIQQKDIVNDSKGGDPKAKPKIAFPNLHHWMNNGYYPKPDTFALLLSILRGRTGRNIRLEWLMGIEIE